MAPQVKTVLKALIILAFPIYFFFAFREIPIKQELSIYVTNSDSTRVKLYLITEVDSSKSLVTQKHSVLNPGEEQRMVLEGSGISPALYIYKEQRVKHIVYEFPIDTSVYNEVSFQEKYEIEPTTDEFKKAVKEYDAENSKKLFLVILFLWVIFIIIYIRSRK